MNLLRKCAFTLCRNNIILISTLYSRGLYYATTMNTERSRIIVQADWEQVLWKQGEKAWVSFRQFGQDMIHSDLKCIGISSDGNPYLDVGDGFSVGNISKRCITISYNNANQSQFLSPLVTFYTVHNKSVECLDVTPGGLAVSSDVTGKCKVWTTDNGEVRRNLEGHAGDVYRCRFFPSGTVILTGGADTQLKIWSAETGQCAATLTGHKAGVTETAVVDKGRNILSSSIDGTVKLWDCGTQTCLGTWEGLGGPVNCCCIQQVMDTYHLGSSDTGERSDKEVLTEGKLLLAATESGQVQGFGLQSREKLFDVTCPSAVNCCSFLSDSTFVCGTQNSELLVMDFRNTSSPVKHMKETRSAIHCILPYNQGFFTTTGDGSCYYTNEVYETSQELTGSDCDPVYRAATDGSFIYTCCRDGLIRKYKIR